VGEREASTSVDGMVLRRGTGDLEVPLCRRFPMRRCDVRLEINGDGDGSDLRGAYIAVELCFWS